MFIIEANIKKDISDTVNDIANQVVNISGIMDDIVKKQKERSNNIKDIEAALKLIKYVSSQTNILGINALIEAAHAGDQGKGFSIIAEQEKDISKTIDDSIKKSNAMTNDLEIMSERIQQIAANLEEINSEMALN